MAEPGEEDAKARSLGLALLDTSRIYEGFVIPSFEGDLRFPPHRRAIIGLTGRQRRFLRAAYTLADAGQVLEAVGPLRSMLEFLVRQLWLARDPDRNWALWMAKEHCPASGDDGGGRRRCGTVSGKVRAAAGARAGRGAAEEGMTGAISVPVTAAPRCGRRDRSAPGEAAGISQGVRVFKRCSKKGDVPPLWVSEVRVATYVHDPDRPDH